MNDDVTPCKSLVDEAVRVNIAEVAAALDGVAQMDRDGIISVTEARLRLHQKIQGEAGDEKAPNGHSLMEPRQILETQFQSAVTDYARSHRMVLRIHTSLMSGTARTADAGTFPTIKPSFEREACRHTLRELKLRDTVSAGDSGSRGSGSELCTVRLVTPGLEVAVVVLRLRKTGGR